MPHFWRRPSNSRRTPARLGVEPLEDRTTPTAYVVTSFADDGSAGTLRSVLTQVNADPASAGADTVTFAAGGTVTLSQGQLEVSRTAGPVTIDAGGYTVTVSGNNASRVLQVDSGVTATLVGLTVANGAAGTTAVGGGINTSGTLTITGGVVRDNTAGDGGGIWNAGGTLTITGSTVSHNTASNGDGVNGDGGGLYNSFGTVVATATAFTGNVGVFAGGGFLTQGGTMTLAASTVSGNSSLDLGGGVASDSGPLTITDCTITGNSGSQGGGVEITNGPVTVTDSTISGNTARSGGGIYVSFSFSGASLTLGGSIVSGNHLSGSGGSGPDLSATTGFTDSGYNLLGTGVTHTGTGDVSTDTPNLAPLGYYGGPTQTMGPLAGSPALGAGAPTDTSADQRGFAPVGRRDVGAFEATPLAVNTTADTPTGVSPAGSLSLRAALNFADADTTAAADTVTFDPTVFTGTQGAIALSGTQLELTRTTGPVTVDGTANGAAGVTVSGNNASRVFEIDSGVTAALVGLTITGGTADNGGGVANAGGALTVAASTVTGNAATASYGGGIYNAGGTLSVTSSTLSGNSAPRDGGGLYNYSGTVSVTSSTVSGNTSYDGGGIVNAYSGSMTVSRSTVAGNTGRGVYAAAGGILNGGALSVTSSTVSGNSADYGGGGVYNNGGTLTITGSIVSGNSLSGGGGAGGADFTGTAPFTDGGYNLFGTGVAHAGTGDVSSDAPLLAPLGDYGGPTQTMALLPGSPALDAGDPAAADADERGVAVQAGGRDIGAFESRGFALTAAASGTPQTAGAGTAFTHPLAVTVTANDPLLTTLAGGVVTFAPAPAPAGSAGATLSAGTATVTSGNTAAVTATANGVAGGPYAVSASAGGFPAYRTTFRLSNAPGVTSLSPAGGPFTGGGTVTITGAGFTGATAVSFGGTPAASFTVVNATTITAVAPAGTVGTTADVTVTAGGLTSATVPADHFLFTEAPSLVVTTLGDSSTATDGVTDLREALAYAATFATGTPTVTFDPAVFDGTQGPIVLSGTQLEVAAAAGVTVAVDGAAGGAKGVTVSGNDQSRVFQIDSGVAATLTGLTITGGDAADASGGGIANLGTLAVTASTIAGNHAALYGGGLYNEGTLRVSTSAVTGNDAPFEGGGIYNTGSLTVTSSTIAGNTTLNYGGGVYNDHGTLAVVASTVAGNTATFGTGGGIVNDHGSLAVANGTIAGNAAGHDGGGVANYGNLRLGGSIVSGNSAASGAQDVGGGISTDDGYNLLGTGAGGNGTTDVSSDVPLLAPLGNHGGPTQTMALLPGSPALDAGGPTDATADQRGVAVQNGRRDIGAFESRGFTLTQAAGSTPQAILIGSPFTNPLSVTVAADDPGLTALGGGTIAFTAPGSGPSAVLSAATATITAANSAAVTATANTFAGGPYTVTASAGGSGPAATFGLTNLPPHLSVTGVTHDEGDTGTTAFDFAVTLSAASGQQVTVHYATADGTATAADGDYADAHGTLTFAPGETSKTITVAVGGDRTAEPDEAFTVALSAPTDAVIDTAAATGTITNDDPDPTASLSVTGAAMAEAGGTTTVTATLSNPSSRDVTVTLGFGGTAGFGTDYAASGTRIVIPAGSLTGNVTLTGLDDALDEPTETAAVSITGVTNGTAGTPGAVTVSILDDDRPLAADAAYSTAEDTPLAVGGAGVLAGDAVATGPATAELVTGPAHGTLTLRADGTFSYAPAPDFNGEDGFTYRIRNGAGEVSLPTAVRLTVTPVNDPPAAGPGEAYTVRAGSRLTVGTPGLLANDTDADGDALSAVLVDSPPAAEGTLALNPNGSFVYTPAPGFVGAARFTYRVTDGTASSDPVTVTLTVTPMAPPTPALAGGTGFDPFPGVAGTETALGDVTGDGTLDVVAGAGDGGGPRVEVFDGRTGAVVRSFFAYDPSFRGGVHVAVGDVTGDGVADIVTGAGVGGAPHVEVFDGKTGLEVASFYAFDSSFRGGVEVAVGDITGDGVPDVIAGAGPGGGPRVVVFDGRSGAEVASFFASATTDLNGVRVGAGDGDGDGFADLALAPAAGAGTQVEVVSGRALVAAGPAAAVAAPLSRFSVAGPGGGGVRVAVRDLGGNGMAEVVARAGAATHVYDPLTGADVTGDFDPLLVAGVFVD